MTGDEVRQAHEGSNRRVLQRSGTDLPAYAASEWLSAALGGIRFTPPYTLFLDEAGRPTHRLPGYIPARTC